MMGVGRGPAGSAAERRAPRRIRNGAAPVRYNKKFDAAFFHRG